jgi:hypothetical protein
MSDQETPEAADAASFNPLAGITALGIVQMTVGLLSERAWVAMGMVADPGTGRIQPDFADAQLAIDALGDLTGRLQPHLDAAQRREVQTELTNLRLNFVRQKASHESAGSAAPSPESAEAEPAAAPTDEPTEEPAGAADGA